MFGFSEAELNAFGICSRTSPEINNSEVERAPRRTGTNHFRELLHEPLDRWFENRIYPSAEGLSVYDRNYRVKRAERFR